MAEWTAQATVPPVARSPIAAAPPVAVLAGWEVSALRSGAASRLSDQTPLTKVQVKAAFDGPMAHALPVGFGRAARGWAWAGPGRAPSPPVELVVGSGPGEWLLLAEPGTAAELVAGFDRLAVSVAPGELVTVTDLTHGRALVRLTGPAAVGLLARMCAMDLSDLVTPDGAAFRTTVAGLATDVVRDDRDGARSYLLHCERSSGQYLFDTLRAAGAELGVEVDGFRPPGA